MARGGFHHGQPSEITSGALPSPAHSYGATNIIGHRGPYLAPLLFLVGFCGGDILLPRAQT